MLRRQAVRARPRQRQRCGQHHLEADEGGVADHQVDRLGHLLRRQATGVGALQHHDPAVLPQLPGELAVADVDGEGADDVAAEALDTSLLLYLDHGLNASTFTCRVISSTLSDIYSAVTGGVGALKGELHGGANEAAMRMILEIESVDRAEKWVDDALDKGKKIMGFGHRVYRTEDPRATHLREMSRRIGEATGEDKWYEISRRVEETMLDRKGINCNVDFYCGIVYHTLGIPLDLFTPLFAAGRVGGWTAHVMEQQADNRLIRPRAEYVGRKDRRFVPLDER